MTSSMMRVSVAMNSVVSMSRSTPPPPPYALLSLLSSYLPLELLLTSLLDLLIFWTYMSWFHPWKHILAQKVKN